MAIAYNDAAGVKTIGYGTTKKEYVQLGTITQAQATQFLKEEINAMARQIKTSLDSKGVVLTQNQFEALCSFAYNCGVGGLLGSTLYARILNGVRDSGLKDNFTAWSKAGGKTLQGLLNRRIEEYEMFADADYTSNL
jgi:lysozyme